MNAQLESVELFARAYQRGRFFRLWSALSGRPNRLHSLAASHARQAAPRRFEGLRSVSIVDIRGSEGRTADFDAGFRPLRKHTRSRWQSIAEAMLRGSEMPPVELIRAGEHYYVVDGHHRISVAAALGQREIDALVTHWGVAECHAGERQRCRPGRAGASCHTFSDARAR